MDRDTQPFHFDGLFLTAVLAGFVVLSETACYGDSLTMLLKAFMFHFFMFVAYTFPGAPFLMLHIRLSSTSFIHSKPSRENLDSLLSPTELSAGLQCRHTAKDLLFEVENNHSSRSVNAEPWKYYTGDMMFVSSVMRYFIVLSPLNPV